MFTKHGDPIASILLGYHAERHTQKQTEPAVTSSFDFVNVSYQVELDFKRSSCMWTESPAIMQAVMQWLQLLFDFDSTTVRRAFACLSGH